VSTPRADGELAVSAIGRRYGGRNRRTRSVQVLRVCMTIAAVLLMAAPASAQTTQTQQVRDEIERLRQEFDALRRQYDGRLAALEARLAAVEGTPANTLAPTQAATPPPPAVVGQPPETQVPPGAAGAGGPTGTLPVYGNASALSKIFNPDIAVIGDFLGAAGRNREEPSPALEMHEAEIAFQAIVDPFARADFFFAAGPEGVEIEEGFITFTSLPGGLLAKVGKIRGAFGKVNTIHNHVLPWTDRPLVTRNLVGGEEGISDAGVSVSKLLLNPWFFLEATGEVYRGQSDVFASHKRSDLAYVGRLRGYRDVSEASNFDLGTSFAYGHNEQGPGFTTRLFGVDATFRYRPLRRAIYKRLLARSELIWSRNQQAAGPTTSFGMYAGGDYQFARRWFAGARYDYSDRAFDPTAKDKGGSLLLTFWPSEFSQVRAQYRRTRFAEGGIANELLFQFLFSIGAHGGHVF
jgi:hypothetical protein